MFRRIQQAIDSLDRDSDAEEYVLKNEGSLPDYQGINLPLKTKVRVEMNFCAMMAALGYTTLSIRLLLLNYYGKYNKIAKIGIGLALYGGCEPAVIFGSFTPLFFDRELVPETSSSTKE